MGLGLWGILLIAAVLVAKSIAAIPLIGMIVPQQIVQYAFPLYFVGGALVGYSYSRNVLIAGMAGVAVLFLLHVMGLATIPLLPRAW